MAIRIRSDLPSSPWVCCCQETRLYILCGPMAQAWKNRNRCEKVIKTAVIMIMTIETISISFPHHHRHTTVGAVEDKRLSERRCLGLKYSGMRRRVGC